MDLSTPKVMGILNITPDSFYDGGSYTTRKEILHRVETMLEEGADFIDVGGVSTRPGAKLISEKTERQRVIPAVEIIMKRFPDAVISVDTFRASVARAAVEEGASLINDISAGAFDENLFETVSRLNVPYVLMHMKGIPETMQKNPAYTDVMTEITGFFVEKMNRLKQFGIKDIILDPGFGFGKTLEHNYEILRNLHDLQIFGLPVMAGISRKSMICKALNVKPAEALNGTTALHGIALLKGADILRVHDVKEAKEVVKLSLMFKVPKA
ncbi:MAG TPA: dihydropteroate synthase [Chitinophagales bacterium]|nr:dihydropteroate synthase [Chitinophagales bacterium]